MNQCIEVDPTLARDKDGYGRGEINIGGRRYSVKAHRIIFEMATGIKIEPGQIVMHTCDNPPCINSDHLILGTHADNIKDKIDKGRQGWQNKPWTHCINGHSFAEHGRIYKGSQYCRTCRTKYKRERYG